MPTALDVTHIAKRLADFARERDWEQFHSPKNIASALSVEAAELLEIFQWLTEEQSRKPSREAMEKVKEEVADVQLYLIRLCDLLNVDLAAAVNAKLAANARKYPVHKARGSSKKYDQL
jgi:NTP pyrophosphatase (non-canonical NTP hydrolase)